MNNPEWWENPPDEIDLPTDNWQQEWDDWSYKVWQQKELEEMLDEMLDEMSNYEKRVNQGVYDDR